MPDMESTITHLQIISTWASFARERDLQFFTKKHLKDIAQWANDAITLLKEQQKLIDETRRGGQIMGLSIDREKVINELVEHIESALSVDSDYADCVRTDLLQYTVAMLKEQEAKQVIKQTYHVMMNRDYENPVEATRYDWLCPTCKSLLCRDIDVIDDNYHFCKVCGQAVKWE